MSHTLSIASAAPPLQVQLPAWTLSALVRRSARHGPAAARPAPLRVALLLFGLGLPRDSAAQRAHTPWLDALSVLCSSPPPPCVPGLIQRRWAAACCAQGALFRLADSVRLALYAEWSPTALALTSLAPSPFLSPTQARTRTPSGHLTGQPAGAALLLPPVSALACLSAQPLVSTLWAASLSLYLPTPAVRPVCR